MKAHEGFEVRGSNIRALNVLNSERMPILLRLIVTLGMQRRGKHPAPPGNQGLYRHIVGESLM